jgi:nucleotide-binding universal stress UspA family protein
MSNIMKILIATDGSDFSREAVKRFCEIVDVSKVKAIKIMSVFENPASFVNAESFPVSAQLVSQIDHEAERQALENVSKAKRIIGEYFPQTSVEIVPTAVMGIPEREIIETSRDWQTDLIVLGSHGRGFWGRAMIGSVSDAVIHNACCPVLVVSGRHLQEKNQTGG